MRGKQSMAVRRRRRRRGGSLGNWLKKANTWLRKHKVVSKGSRFLANAGVHPKILGQVARYSSKLGYGVSRAGSGCGGALRRAGSGRRVRYRRR